jgi:hypothetical protein
VPLQTEIEELRVKKAKKSYEPALEESMDFEDIETQTEIQLGDRRDSFSSSL